MKKKVICGYYYFELVGFVLFVFGFFFVVVFWVGWNGGYVGVWIVDGFEVFIGGVVYGFLFVFVVVGGFMVVCSDLVDVWLF